ncbi:hypothetical protein GIB67_034140, partial [Kingdonia uniflora]
SERVVEEFDLDCDNTRLPGLKATKPGENPRVVVLGTGWASCRLFKGIDTKIYDVVCVSPRNHMVLTPLLASTYVGTLEFRSVVEPVSRIQPALVTAPNSYFYLVYYKGVDLDKHELKPLTFNINGVKEHAYFFREVNHAQEIRKRLLLNLMLSENSGISEEEKKRLLHCVIIGGGPTGVEFSGELSNLIMKDVRERYSHVKDDVRVTLIEANEILSSFDIGLRQYATKHLTKCGIHHKKGVVKEFYSKKIVLNDRTDVSYGLLVWFTGVGPSDFVKSLNLPKSQGGWISIDEWMRVPSVEDVFVLGDCAGFLEKTGKQGVTRHWLTYARLSVQDEKGISQEGFVSWLIWRSAYLTRAISWRNKFYVAVNWVITLVFGRDNSRIG